MGDLAGKIIEGIIKEVVSGDFDVNKLLNIGVPVKTYTTTGRPTNQMMQRQYSTSGGMVNDVDGRSYYMPNQTTAPQTSSGTEPVTGALDNGVDRRATISSQEGPEAHETIADRTFAVSRSPLSNGQAYRMPGAEPVAGGANNKAFSTRKSQGSSGNVRAASADNNSQSVTKMHPTAASNVDTIQPILQEEKDGPGFKLKLDDQSLLNGFVLSEILGKPKYLRRERW